jgi:signal transduction histidine kinase
MKKEIDVIEKLRAKIERLTTINETAYSLNHSLEIDVCVKNFIDAISSILKAEVASLMLLDKKKKELMIKMAKGLREEVVKTARIKLGDGVAGRVAKEMKPLLVKNVKKSPYRRTKNGRDYKTDSFMSVPLMVDNEILGVVNVTDKKDKTDFTQEDLEMFKSVADHTAVSIKNSILYEKLKRIDKAKSDFFATLSHELRAPLTNVLGAVDLLLEDSRGIMGMEEKKFLEIAKDNLRRMFRLINDLLDVTKLESGAVTMKRARFDVLHLARSVAASFKPAVEKKSINMSVSPPKGSEMIWGDTDRLGQALTNLLSNAVKFTPPKGRIKLTVAETKDNILKIVEENTGPVIVKEDIPKLFDKFSSLSVDKVGATGGTGLGLSITKDIVEMHKGRIWAEPRQGEGMRFVIEIPKDLRGNR